MKKVRNVTVRCALVVPNDSAGYRFPEQLPILPAGKFRSLIPRRLAARLSGRKSGKVPPDETGVPAVSWGLCGETSLRFKFGAGFSSPALLRKGCWG